MSFMGRYTNIKSNTYVHRIKKQKNCIQQDSNNDKQSLICHPSKISLFNYSINPDTWCIGTAHQHHIPASKMSKEWIAYFIAAGHDDSYFMLDVVFLKKT